MRTLILRLTEAEAEAISRAELSCGHGVVRSQALLSAEAKIDAALLASRKGEPDEMTEMRTTLASLVAAFAALWAEATDGQCGSPNEIAYKRAVRLLNKTAKLKGGAS